MTPETEQSLHSRACLLEFQVLKTFQLQTSLYDLWQYYFLLFQLILSNYFRFIRGLSGFILKAETFDSVAIYNKNASSAGLIFVNG